MSEPVALDRKLVTLWRQQALLAAAGVLAAAVALTVGVALDDGPAAVVGGISAALVAACFAVAWSLPARVYPRWSYVVADTALEIRHGAFVRRHSVIPYFRVQHVDTSKGPFERRLGLVELKIHTASSATDASIPGLAEDIAAELRALIVARAGLTEGV